MQELQKKITEVVASMYPNLPIEQTQFFSTSTVNDVNFQQTLQREAFWHA